MWDVRVIKPLDPDMICDAARHALVVTAEDGVRDGGAGAAMADAIADLDESRQSPPVLVLGTPTATSRRANRPRSTPSWASTAPASPHR